MLLKTFRKVNANRFTKRYQFFNSNFLQTCNMLKSVRMCSSFFYKYNKIKKFYNKKNMNYSSRILLPIKFKNLICSAPYHVLSIKKISNSDCIIGLCEMQIHEFFYKRYNKHHYIFLNDSWVKSYNNINNLGSLFFIKLFHGYRLLNVLYNINTNVKSINNKVLMPGSITFLKCVVVGSFVYNIILNRYKIKYAMSPGTSCMVLNLNTYNRTAMINIPSGLHKTVDLYSIVILGRNANILSKFIVLGKASNKFFLKKKNVTTRGVAMNPIDHPNGGRSKIKKPFRSIWGWSAKKGK